MEPEAFYVTLTVNCGQDEYDHVIPRAYSLDQVLYSARLLYPKATSIVLSVVPNVGDDHQAH